MKATNSEAKNKVQLLNCQANLSPCSSNNFGTIEIPKRAKVSIAMTTSGEWFGCSFHFFNVSDIFLLSIVDLNMCAKIRFKKTTFATIAVVFPATFIYFYAFYLTKFSTCLEPVPCHLYHPCFLYFAFTIS